MTKSVLVTGSRGFIGRNLISRLRRSSEFRVLEYHRETQDRELDESLRECDFVVHLAGVNRPKTDGEFGLHNVELTRNLLKKLESVGAKPVLFASSTQIANDTPYGKSKLQAEELIEQYSQVSGMATRVVRLPNVFGKWARPNYNSVVSTFVHNVCRREPLVVSDPDRVLSLAYIDDVVEQITKDLLSDLTAPEIGRFPIYYVTVRALADMITEMHRMRIALEVPSVGSGLHRALYATYISALETKDFSYDLEEKIDYRGKFVEVLRTHTSGQISYLTAKPGVTRGSHYHHTKVEKFVVVAGSARFGFRHLLTGEKLQIIVSGETPKVVESIPGWIHEITNIGDSELLVLVWASELFDPYQPDTFSEVV